MEIEAKWLITAEYFQSYYRDWIRDVSKGRKWSIPIGIALMTVGALLLSTEYGHRKENEFISYGALILGLYQFFWYFREKQQWLKSMKKASSTNGEISMSFSPNGIEHSGPTSSGKMSWGAIEAIIPSRNGVFLRIQKGISIYIPNSAFQENDGPSRVLSLFEQHRN